VRRVGELETLMILAVLRLGDGAYGVTVLEELERETSRTLTLGTVYKTLLRLEDKGYLRSRASDPVPERGGRQKKLYEVTPSGLETVRHSVGDMRRMTRGLETQLAPEMSG
jgi:DNA-binding PadR family transcriptional regulator